MAMTPGGAFFTIVHIVLVKEEIPAKEFAGQSGGVTEKMDKYVGIDVSDIQGVIDWGLVKQDGCRFAILRSIKQSGKPDQQFAANLRGCREQGIPVAVYKYTYAKTAEEAGAEAQQVISLLQENNLKCRIFWDVEDKESLHPLGKEKLTEVIKAAEQVITNAGYVFGIYAGLYVYKEQWFDFAQFTGPLWVARYPVSGVKTLADLPQEKYKPDVGRALYGWQFTSTGKVNGIQGNVDLDLLYEPPATLEQSPPEERYTFFAEEISYVRAQQLLEAAGQMDIKGKLFREV